MQARLSEIADAPLALTLKANRIDSPDLPAPATGLHATLDGIRQQHRLVFDTKLGDRVLHLAATGSMGADWDWRGMRNNFV